jgi:4a-hydroxytetrahydrobiopterin dehydratase
VLILHRHYVTKNFQTALDSINAIGAIAEREGHHPNLHLTNYREVEIEIYTHKLNGLSKNDFILAEQISKEVSIDYSPKWLRENPDASSTSVAAAGK